MKVNVDYGICESNGLCAGVAPEIFDLDDDDNLHLLQEDVTPDTEDDVREAIRQCPRQAIALES